MLFTKHFIVTSLFILCLVSSIAAQGEWKAPPKVKIESAMRVKTIVDSEGKEQSCAQPEFSPSSCLLLRVSGIEPNNLLDIWINKDKGGIYVTAGQNRYDVSTIKIQDKSKFSLIEMTVPQGRQRIRSRNWRHITHIIQTRHCHRRES